MVTDLRCDTQREQILAIHSDPQDVFCSTKPSWQGGRCAPPLHPPSRGSFRALNPFKSQQIVSPINHSQAYYHAINAAYLELALNDDRDQAAEMARRAIDHAQKEGHSYWAEATIAEAHLQLGDPKSALEWYGRAAASNPPIRRLEQTAIQAERVAALRFGDDVVAELRAAMPLGDDA